MNGDYKQRGEIMKKVIVIFIFITVILTCHNFIFAHYNGRITEQELYKRVEQIFYKRSNIWNNFLIGRYTSLSQLEKELREIVTDPLFKSDMKMFKQMLSIPTSYEGISDVSILDIHAVKNSFERAVLEVLILWEIEGYENNYNEEIEYIVEMKRDRGNWLLSDYKINK